MVSDDEDSRAQCLASVAREADVRTGGCCLTECRGPRLGNAIRGLTGLG